MAEDRAEDVDRDQIMHSVHHFNESEFYSKGNELKGFKQVLIGIVF